MFLLVILLKQESKKSNLQELFTEILRRRIMELPWFHRIFIHLISVIKRSTILLTYKVDITVMIFQTSIRLRWYPSNYILWMGIVEIIQIHLCIFLYLSQEGLSRNVSILMSNLSISGFFFLSAHSCHDPRLPRGA